MTEFLSKELQDCSWKELIAVILIVLITGAAVICTEAFLFMLLWNALIASMTFVEAVIATIFFSVIAAIIKWFVTFIDKSIKSWKK